MTNVLPSVEFAQGIKNEAKSVRIQHFQVKC